MDSSIITKPETKRLTIPTEIHIDAGFASRQNDKVMLFFCGPCV